jgi:predicted ester cyclase
MNKQQFISEFFKTLWIDREISIVKERCVNDIIVHHYNRICSGEKSVTEIATQWFNAFPNKDKVYIEKINKINDMFYYIKWYGIAKHEGMFWDLPATGKMVDYKGICFFEIKDHLIYTYHTESNTRMNLINSGSFSVMEGLST